MKRITIIAAIGKNNELGKNNDLIWKIPEDLKFFKEQTLNKPIVMGKNTLDSLPGLLPNRLHLVLTHQKIEETEQLKVFNNYEKLLEFIDKLDEEVMIIGGAQIYKMFIDIADKLVLTEIDAIEEADTYFPIFNKKIWQKETISTHIFNDIKYTHVIYKKY